MTTNSTDLRNDGRTPEQLRPVTVKRHFTAATAGSVLVQAGRTTVLCTASVDESEYNMLPGSTSPRKRRDRTKVDGRTTEIQRLIGRSLRAVVDFRALGPRTVTVDCDVLEADGGTRTLSITGGFIALVDALAELDSGASVLRDSLAAISVGVIDGTVVLDPDYSEDSRADVDMNVVMTGTGRYIEIQGTAEGRAFGRDVLNQQLALSERGIRSLTNTQRTALGENWPLR